VCVCVCVCVYVEDRYCCAKCHENFLYPNCLRAHMRFRCKYRQQLVLGVQSQTEYCDNRKRHSEELRHIQTSDPDTKLPSKRKRADNVDNALLSFRHSGSGSTTKPEVENRLRVAKSTNGVETDSSAFQCVQLPPASPTSGPTTSTSAATSGASLTADGAAAAAATGLFLFPGLAAAPQHALPVGIQASERLTPAFPRVVTPQELAPINGLSNNNNNNNDSRSHNKMAAAGVVGGMVHPDPRVPMPLVYRSPNPVIDKMLNLFGSAAAVAAAAAAATAGAAGASTGPLATSFPSLSLSQNWCAKCNTSFRMTSDLVYHMRSHHKREFDPVKRRKDDKLRCDVCGESFRERHHLTRHMTSHS